MNAVDDLQHSPGHTARGQSRFMVSSARHDHMCLAQTAAGARAVASEATGAPPVVGLDLEFNDSDLGYLTDIIMRMSKSPPTQEQAPFVVSLLHAFVGLETFGARPSYIAEAWVRRQRTDSASLTACSSTASPPASAPPAPE